MTDHYLGRRASPATPRRPARVLWVCLVACALGAGLASCDSSTPPAASPTTRPSGPTSTSPGGGDPSTEVLAAYREMWADLVAAARTSDFQSPLLSHYTTGDAHTLFVQGLAHDQLHGIVTRGEPVIDPRISSLTPAGHPTRATVTDCFDDAHWLEYTTSGARAKNTPGGRRATTADLIMSRGTWKVTELAVGSVGSC